jgi:hypothetical protein
MNFTDKQRKEIEMFHPLFEALNPKPKRKIALTNCGGLTNVIQKSGDSILNFMEKKLGWNCEDTCIVNEKSLYHLLDSTGDLEYVVDFIFEDDEDYQMQRSYNYDWWADQLRDVKIILT